jgi:hypothetical membrane protein
LVGGTLFNKFFPQLGLAAVIFYVLAVLVGGAITPGYNHIYNTISELSIPGQPDRWIINSLFILYNLSLFLFAAGGFQFVHLLQQKIARLVFILVMVSAVLGIAFIIFPQDVRGAEATTAGTIHIILAGLTSPITIVCTILMGILLIREKNLHTWGIAFVVLSILILISGAATAYGVATNSMYGGLLERTTIGIYLLWIAILSIMIIKNKAILLD